MKKGAIYTFKKWIDERISSVIGHGVSNCIGTALYIVGEREYDTYLYGKEHEEILSKLNKSKYPGIGYLVGWVRTPYGYPEDEEETVHLGVIIKTNPFLITHRNGPRESLIKKDPIKRANKWWRYRYPNSQVRYYVPTKLEQMFNQAKLIA